jgi:hypothetical protein
LTVHVSGSTHQFREAAAKIRRAKAGLGTKLRDEFRKVARPVLAELKAEFRASSMESKLMGAGQPSYSRGLRERVAAATDFTATQANGVTFVVHGDQVDPVYGWQLAHGVNGRLWYHPVFARLPLEFQTGTREILAPLIEDKGAEFRRACDRAAQEVFRMMS